MALIGVISDTHGLLRDQVRSIFKNCDLIIHAGDIGKAGIIKELEKIQRVVAVRGNVDPAGLIPGLKEIENIEFGEISFLLLHNINDLPKAGNKKPDMVIYGHSHKPEIRRSGQTLYFNPGSAGPKRFHLPVTLGLLRIEGNKLLPEILNLED